MNMPAYEFAQYLVAQGYGTLGSTVLVDASPDEVADIISVLTTGGMKPSIYLPNALPTVEILARGSEALTTFNKISAIAKLLDQKMNSTLITGGNYYYSINLMGEINNLGRDDKGRIEYSINLETKIRER